MYLLTQFRGGGFSQDSLAISCNSNDKAGIDILNMDVSFEACSLMHKQALAFQQC